MSALKKVFSGIEVSTKPTPFIDIVVRKSREELSLPPMEIFYSAFEKFVELFREYGGALVFIDEPQNFLNLQDIEIQQGACFLLLPVYLMMFIVSIS